MTDELCMHEMVPAQCSICKAGPTLRSAEPAYKIAECNSCQAEIIWVVTEKAKPMPINAERDPVNGRFRIEGETVSGTPRVHFVKDAELESNDKPLYASHFQTCVDSAAWKRSR